MKKLPHKTEVSCRHKKTPNLCVTKFGQIASIKNQTGNNLKRKVNPMPRRMVTGKVTNQAVTMLFAVDQLTAERRFAEPTPMMDEEITCVVLTGAPIAVIT